MPWSGLLPLRKLVATTALVSALNLSAPPASAGEKVVLQLKWKHAFQFAGYYAAVEKGFYRDAGLEVEMREGGPETNFADELASGHCQYAVALSSMVLHRVEGKPIVAMAAILQHSPEVLLVLNSSGINTPHQMAGRIVAASPEDTPALLAMFKNEGLAPTAVKTIPYEFSVDKMRSGEIAGMGAYSINEPFRLRQQGIGYRLIQPRDYGVDFYGDCLFTSEAEIRDHPRRAKSFLDATLKGWNYAMGHRAEIIDLLIERYHCPLSREALMFEADQMAKLMFSELIDVGHMNEGRWRHIADTYVRLGMIKPDYSLEGFLYDRNPPRSVAWLWGTLGVAVASSLVLGGVVMGLMSINRRVSDAEKQARESQSMLQTILNAIPVGVFWKDRSSHILGCNQVFADQTGLDVPKRAKGLSTATLPVPWRDARDSESDREVLEEGKSILQTERTTTLPNGGTRHVYQSKVPLRNEDGDIIGMVGVVEDVSSLKEAEERQFKLKERLLHAQKYESLHRLANGVCHHSNNILQAISSYAELALMKEPNSASRDHLEGVLRESRRAAALNRLLLISTGQGRHHFRNAALDTLLSEMLPSLRESLPPNHKIDWKPGATDAVIHADSDSLRQLFLNLVLNASEAMEGKDEAIHVSTGVMICDEGFLETVAVDPPPAGQYAYVEVKDTGMGMTQEVLKMVFDPFFSTKFTGRGLGMAAALGIAKSHHGGMKISSEPDKGTTVRVLLPLVLS
jgi:PAS domain S-box-containing protein